MQHGAARNSIESGAAKLLAHRLGMGRVHVRHCARVPLGESTRASLQFSCVLHLQPRFLLPEFLRNHFLPARLLLRRQQPCSLSFVCERYERRLAVVLGRRDGGGRHVAPS